MIRGGDCLRVKNAIEDSDLHFRECNWVSVESALEWLKDDPQDEPAIGCDDFTWTKCRQKNRN
jgi:hypothetical protein